MAAEALAPQQRTSIVWLCICQVVQGWGNGGNSSLPGVGRWEKGFLPDLPEELTLRMRM